MTGFVQSPPLMGKFNVAPMPYPPVRGRSPAGLLALAALIVAMVSAVVGGGTALALCPLIFGVPAPGLFGGYRGATSAGSIEQVAAKVLPSVVKLEVTAAGEPVEGSGIVLRSDGLILTNDHLVAVHDSGRARPQVVTRTVTFADGRVAPFTVVGGDPVGDIAVVRVHDISGLSPIWVRRSTSRSGRK
jgi:putative serine protease PepD